MAETVFDTRAPVLVTGGTGFVGSHLVERLVAEGYRVRCLVRRTSSLAWLPAGKVELAYGEAARNEGLREAVTGAALVFHAAGVTKARRPEEYHQGNVEGTANLVRALEENGEPGVRLVHVSSLAAVGPSPDGTPLTEDAVPRPLTHYGRSKLEGERIIERSRVKANAIIVRPAVVYGPRDTDVLKMFRTACRGLLLRIGREESYVSLVHVADLVEGLLAAARSPYGDARAYFAANPEPVSWSGFAGVVAELAGRRLRTIRVPLAAAWALGLLAEAGSRFSAKPSILSREKIREARCRWWVCDTRRARRELGFTAKKSLREGIAETLEWYRISRWLRP
jgi:nucleoside-diphosphate-sugar epimerase